jgi:hypothetical protein
MRSGRLSFFAAASWLVPFFVFVMMKPYVAAAAARDARNHAFFHGLSEGITQLGVTAGLAFSLGFISIIRRERLWWIGAISCFFGGLFLCGFALVILGEKSRSALPAIQGSLDLTIGILLALNGVFFLVWLLPKASVRLAREQEADGIGEKEARMKTKEVKLFGIATLIAGIGFILIHVFDLF